MPHLDFSTYLGQIFWLLVIFSAIFVLFNTKFVPRATKVLERREHSIKKDLEAAQSLNKELEGVKEEIARQKQEVQEQTARVIGNARSQAALHAEEELRKLEHQLVQTRHEAEQKLLALKLNSQPVVNTIATEVALQLCNKLELRDLDQTALKRIISSKTVPK